MSGDRCCAPIRITTVYGDNFAAGSVRELFQRRIGVNYISHGVPAKSQIYLTALTYVNSQQCRLFDIPRLLDQALQLERSPGRDGHGGVDHAFGAHDDLINAYAGAVVMALKRAAIDRSAAGDHPAWILCRRHGDQRAARTDGRI